jgi:hypothetical protein
MCIRMSDTWIVCSKPTRDTDVSPRVLVLSYVGRGLATGYSPRPRSATRCLNGFMCKVNFIALGGGQSGTGTGFLQVFGLPCRYHSTAAPYSLMYGVCGEWTMGPTAGAVHRDITQSKRSVKKEICLEVI